jgi:hypothetical protein
MARSKLSRGRARKLSKQDALRKKSLSAGFHDGIQSRIGVPDESVSGILHRGQKLLLYPEKSLRELVDSFGFCHDYLLKSRKPSEMPGRSWLFS